MSTIYTVEGNTSGGSTLVANGGGVFKKSYHSSYARISCIFRPKYKDGEALKVAKEALKYVGYLEKATNSCLEDFTKNAGYNNFNMFAPHAYKMTKSGVYTNGVAWCDIFVDDVFIRALGVTRAKELLGGWSAYTPTSANFLRKCAKEVDNYETTKYGDIIFFKNSSGICHTGLLVTSIPNSDGSLSKPANTKYTKKKFIKEVCKILKVDTAKEAYKKTVTLSRKVNSKHALVLPVQKYLKSLGYYKGVCDRDFGAGTEEAVNMYQKKKLKYKKVDGTISSCEKMWKSLLGLK